MCGSYRLVKVRSTVVVKQPLSTSLKIRLFVKSPEHTWAVFTNRSRNTRILPLGSGDTIIERHGPHKSY